MGKLEDTSGARHPLPARCIIGRHPACALVVEHPRISGEHASVQWSGEHWQLRDLGSRNGTFVAGRRVESGERVALSEGATFFVGGPDTSFTLADASPPEPAARAQDTGEWHTGDDNILVLPDADSALATVYQDRKGKWMMDTHEHTAPVTSGQAVTVGERIWMLELPVWLPPTWVDEGDMAPSLATIVLTFRVSRDEEQVELSYVHGGQVTRFPARVYHYMVLTLARLRVRDRDLPEADRGWVHREELCKMLAVDYTKLNVDIYRARREIAAAGISDGASIIERRQGLPEIRLSTDRVQIETM